MLWGSLIVFHLFLFGNLLSVLDAKKNQQFNERADLYAQLKDCDFYESNEKNYTDFLPIDAFENEQMADTRVRFSVYVIAARDAHFCLSAKEWPNWENDFAYEILIGGWGNTRSGIRKKISAYSLSEVRTDGLLNIRKPTKLLIEITKAGYINVYSGDEPKPFISAFDPKPIPVKYISFAGHDKVLQVEFLYNCSSTSEVSTMVAPPTVTTENSISSLTDVDISVLAARCQVVESWEHIYDNFIPLNAVQKGTNDNNIFKIELFVVASRDANILLSSDDKVNVTSDDFYEIVIGGQKNSRHFIRRRMDGQPLTELELLDILSPNKQVKVVIQRAEDGLIEVFLGDKYYKPILRTLDDNPLPVNFISFASDASSRAMFFYNCNEAEDDHSEEAEHVTVHPLLATRPIDDINELNKQCKVYQAFENEYQTAYEIAKFRNAPTNTDAGYYFRLPLYVQGERDASILLSADQNDNTHDVYEIIIGGWGNTRTVVNKNGVFLAEAVEYNILDENKPVKLIVELSTADSSLKIFTDYNKYKPLLSVTDPDPIKNIQYVSFAGYYRDLKFFFNCMDSE